MALEPGSDLYEQALALCSAALLDGQAADSVWADRMDTDRDLAVGAGTARELG
jgi:hypothetical protein